MPTYAFVTVDVFTDTRFGGNPLAVFTDARGLSDAEMQALATEFNLSETTFVLPPEDPANTARIRIFNTTAEMPFAGHPMVGTGYVLARLRDAAGHGATGPLRFEVPAGLVTVEIERSGDGAPLGGVISAPLPLSAGETFPPEIVAACAGLAAHDIVTSVHPPVLASVGNPFVIAEVTDAALARAAPNVDAFRKAEAAYPQEDERFSLHLYARTPSGIRARMFAPLTGTFEDPATGSANAPLAALLLSLTDAPSTAFDVRQGVEMGRPSLLRLTATRGPDGIRATVGGRCVPVLSGEAIV
ncbi:MAG: PhzF family phenazine biosynthesis protein [Rhizobiaceae bacterium]|nr:PhzF family phenazine biosynthesis protein [Rhizobiaceae bacterium]